MRTLIILFMLVMGFSLQAQQQVTWKHYKIQVTVPDDFKVAKNTDNEFEMNGDGMGMYMYIFDGNISAGDMSNATVSAANEMKLGSVDQAVPFKNGDFQGYYVEGEKDGARVMFAGVIDNSTKTNFFIAITFGDNDEVAEKDALEILESIDQL